MSIKRLARSFRQGLDKIVQETEIPAETGLDNEDGTFTLKVDNLTNRIWVRLYGEKAQTVQAFNTQVGLKSQLPVLVKRNRFGQYEVVRLDAAPATEALADAATHYANPQRYGELENIVYENRNFKPGRVRLYQESTLIVWIEPFDYLHEDTPQHWPGGTLDVTSFVTATSGMQNMIKVGVDPATNTAVGEAGPDYPGMLSLADGLHTEIAFAGYVPCGVVIVKNGETTISDLRRFIDCRVWIWQTQLGGGGGMTSFTLAADTGTPETIANGNALTVAGGTDIDTSVAATDTVTVNASNRVSAAASLYLYDTYFNFS